MRTEGKHNSGYQRSNMIGKMNKFGLPKDLRSVWPDVFPNRTIFSKPSDSGIMLFDAVRGHISTKRKDPILEIGAADNTLVEHLRKKGYEHAVGIDMAPIILNSRYGRHINFRDLPRNESFKMILFVNVLDYFEGGCFDHLSAPSLEIFARKLDLHIKPKGYIAFIEIAPNKDQFTRELKKLGFKELTPYLWQRT